MSDCLEIPYMAVRQDMRRRGLGSHPGRQQAGTQHVRARRLVCHPWTVLSAAGSTLCPAGEKVIRL